MTTSSTNATATTAACTPSLRHGTRLGHALVVGDRAHVRGRHVVAAKAIPAGTIVFASYPSAVIPLGVLEEEICHECLQRPSSFSSTSSPPPSLCSSSSSSSAAAAAGTEASATREPPKLSRCAACQWARYCSRTCQLRAWKRVHKRECAILKTRCARDWTDEQRLALRVFLRYGEDFEALSSSKDSSASVSGDGNSGDVSEKGGAGSDDITRRTTSAGTSVNGSFDSEEEQEENILPYEAHAADVAAMEVDQRRLKSAQLIAAPIAAALLDISSSSSSSSNNSSSNKSSSNNSGGANGDTAHCGSTHAGGGGDGGGGGGGDGGGGGGTTSSGTTHQPHKAKRKNKNNKKKRGGGGGGRSNTTTSAAAAAAASTTTPTNTTTSCSTTTTTSITTTMDTATATTTTTAPVDHAVASSIHADASKVSTNLETRIANYIAASKCNNFAIHNDLLVPRGAGVYPLGALLNHACDGNCAMQYINVGSGGGGGGKALTKTKTSPAYHVQTVRTLRNVAKGEELCHAYIDVAATRTARLEILQMDYNFVCDCIRCCSSSSSSSSSSIGRNDCSSSDGVGAGKGTIVVVDSASERGAAEARLEACLCGGIIDPSASTTPLSIQHQQEKQQQQQQQRRRRRQQQREPGQQKSVAAVLDPLMHAPSDSLSDHLARLAAPVDLSTLPVHVKSALRDAAVMHIKSATYADDAAEVEAALETSLRTREQYLHPLNLDLLASLSWAYNLALEMGNAQRARSLAARLLVAYEAIYPPGHPVVSIKWLALAEHAEAAGDERRASLARERARDRLIISHGKLHPLTLACS